MTIPQVTWDEHSLFVRGERIFLYSGEFHPWRLPSVDLWTDVLQKIKAIGYNGVSFYVDWAPLEGSPGHFSAEGVFAYEPFFAAAEEVGLYLIARPGPYSEYNLVMVPSYFASSADQNASQCRGFWWRVPRVALAYFGYPANQPDRISRGHTKLRFQHWKVCFPCWHLVCGISVLKPQQDHRRRSNHQGWTSDRFPSRE